MTSTLLAAMWEAGGDEEEILRALEAGELRELLARAEEEGLCL